MKFSYITIISVLIFSISCNRTKTKMDPAFEYQIVTEINGEQFAHSLGANLVAPKEDFPEKLSEFIFKELQESGEQKILVHMSLHQNTLGKIQEKKPVFRKLNRWSFLLDKHGDGFRLSYYESKTVVMFSETSEMSVWIGENMEKFVAKEAL